MIKQVQNYEGLYEVDNLGNIYSLPRRGTSKNKIKIKTRVNKFGYEQCVLMKNNKMKTHLVHRIVAIAFIENKNRLPQINHINGNKQDNRVENLEWCSCSQNTRHAFEKNLNGFRDKVLQNCQKMNKDMYKKVVLKNGNQTFEFCSTREASMFLNTHKDNITRAFRLKQKCKGYYVLCERTANGET